MEYVIFIGILLVLSIAMAMDLSWNNVITAERNTMVFADRNREYGAYVLRRDYVKRLLIAVVGSVLVFGLAVGLPKIIAAMGGEEEVVEVKKIVDVNLDLFEEEKKEEPPPPPGEPPPPDAIESVQFTQLEAGDEPADDWLVRNYALETLLEEASGRYVLFLDVDARVRPETIELLMRRLMTDGAAMMTIIPQRADMWRQSAWFGRLRYFWEIIFHSRRAPGVSS
ncbi:MAG: glycosyltransferase, partial [Flavobacteriales bacterium]